jgi:hypothetical protein
MGLHNAAPKDMPAAEVIVWCLDSKVFDGSYNMWSVIGMLLYLMNTPRADCAFAMNHHHVLILPMIQENLITKLLSG